MKPTGKYDWTEGTWDGEDCWQAPIEDEFLAVVIEDKDGKRVMLDYFGFQREKAGPLKHTRNVLMTLPKKSGSKPIEQCVEIMLKSIKMKIGR